MRPGRAAAVLLVAVALFWPESVFAQNGHVVAPRAEGRGPYGRALIRSATVVDGTGAGLYGPVDIWIAGNRIERITSAGERSPALAEYVLDASGCTVLPGFIDMHVHLGDRRFGVPAEYQYKLWLAHGITTVREVGSADQAWAIEQKRASVRNAITAPRLYLYTFLQSMDTEAQIESSIRDVAKRGFDGLKFPNPPSIEVARAVYRVAHANGLRVTTHNASPFTIRELAAAGLDCMEHWYGLPESLCSALPMDYGIRGSTQAEAEYFRENGTRWRTAYEQGRDSWPAVADELIATGLTLVPTLSVYAACADLDAARYAPWQAEYTHPNLAAYFAPDPLHHGSFWDTWTRADEETWTDNLALWGRFLLLYHERGGRVAVGTDEGFMYNVFGFGYVRHLEMLVQAGFAPLDVVRAATLSGAEALGAADRLGSIEEGKLADLVVVRGDPLRDFAILDDSVVATVKDGIVFDARALLADVRAMVADAKRSAMP